MGFTVSRQMDKKLTRQPSKKGYFCGQQSKSRLKLTSSLLQLIFPAFRLLENF